MSNTYPHNPGDSGDATYKPYYTVAEAARRLQVSPSTVWRWIDANKLPAYRIGERTIWVRKEDLDAIVRPANTPAKGVSDREEHPHERRAHRPPSTSDR